MATFAARKYGLRVFNTLTKRVEEFRPISGNRVFMFVCGPTVYDYSHLGHARTFVFFDVVARYLRRLGYSLFYIMNITDVDDKIIRRAGERGVHPLELAREFEEKFYEDMKALHVTSVNLYARASDYLPEIFEQIRGLLEKGYAYETETGVYFDISKFPDYGKLSGRKPEELIVHRIEPDPTKRNPGDFALWRKRPRSELGWESPWGYGRPGWHIEDTAITIKHFGSQYDIHGGAIELSFPHHEAEIAQAEAYTGVKPFVRYWIHTGLLTVNGEKMSKSLGNFITIREALGKYDADTLRLFLLSAHYRGPLDFSWDLVEQARKNMLRIKSAVNALKSLEDAEHVDEEQKALAEEAVRAADDFAKSMSDDFRTPEAIAALLRLAARVNGYANTHSEISPAVRQQVESAFEFMLGTLGILEDWGGASEAEKLMELVNRLVEVAVYARSIFRSRKEWDIADEIRARLRELGVELVDTPQGTKWRLHL